MVKDATAASMSQISSWIQAQELKTPKMKNAPTFYRNLEKTLDMRRAEHRLITLRKRQPGHFDFSSNDFLSLASTGMLRAAFFEELAKHPNFQLGSTGSRLLDGNNDYIEQIESEIAKFHGTETATIVNSGFEGNCAIFSTIPRAGDAIVFDELIHASVHEGMHRSMARVHESFRHNDVDSFRDTLEMVRDSNPLIEKGERCIIVAVETVYSMDGDVCPLKELVEVVHELFPQGNVQFVVDEAHTTGVVGPKGVGLVGHLGLQKDIAIRLHTYSKALACSGGVILSNETVKLMLVNHARPLTFTASPSFPTLAAIRAGYKLLGNGDTTPAQERLQARVKYFYKCITSHPVWGPATKAGIFDIPLAEGYETRDFLTQIIPVITKEKDHHTLYFHLALANYWAFPIDPPVVPKGTGRVRLVFKATTTEAECEGLANTICEWAQEIMEIRKAGVEGALPTAARHVYTCVQGANGAGK